MVGHHPSRVRDELEEEVVLGRGERDELAADGHLALCEVDAHVAAFERVRADRLGARAVAAHDRVDPRDELLLGERLRDVVVRPELEAAHAVRLSVAGGEDDDRYVAPAAAERTEDGESVDLGHREIEDDEVPGLPCRALQRVRAAVRLDDLVLGSLVRDPHPHEVRDVGLIVDDEDPQTGSSTTKTLPTGTRSSMRMVPPCSSASVFAIARPRPDPPGSSRWAGRR